MTTRADHAAATFDAGYNCAQAVLSAFAQDLGIDPVTALKISCGFGSGMGATDNVCGAVSGAVIAIGTKYGKVKRDDNAAKDMTYATVAELVRQFRERNGTVMCTGLIGYNLSDPVQLARAREKGLFRTVCRKYVQDAVEIAEGLI